LSAEPILWLDRADRHFGPVQVLFGVDFALAPGRVHALIGENGAGKSTAMKMLAGYLAPTGGRVGMAGVEPGPGNTPFAGPQAAEAMGVVMIHQELNLAEQLSVEENLFLGRELKRGWRLNHAAMQAEARRLLDLLETPVDPRTRVRALSVSEKQMVEIARALGRDARVIVMDEPTAVLTEREAEVLFRQIERLRVRGVAILYTSHKLGEIGRVADDVTVLRDGHVVAQGPASGFDEDRMAREMVGRTLTDIFPEHPKAPGDTVLEVEGLTVPGRVRDLSFTLRRGEVLALAGLVGAGRTEAMEGLMGLRTASGQVRVDGADLALGSMRRSVAAGLGYLTEDRKGKGLLLTKALAENLTLSAWRRFVRRGLIDRAAEAEALDHATEAFSIRAADPAAPAGNLSGGNQQKLLFAKTLLTEPRIVILDEPTRGVDIGTKVQIYHLIRDLVDEGRAVIVISSEMAEVIGLADRVLVMRSGRRIGVLEGDAIGEEAIVRLAMGVEAVEADVA
jgi:ribose transport system ATP-binding protein